MSQPSLLNELTTYLALPGGTLKLEIEPDALDRPIFPGPPDTQGAQAERIERVLVTNGHFI